jgi:hypothetical protein
MPLKLTLTKSGIFDPHAVTILLEAFDGVVAEFGLHGSLRSGKRTWMLPCSAIAPVALIRNELM